MEKSFSQLENIKVVHLPRSQHTSQFTPRSVVRKTRGKHKQDLHFRLYKPHLACLTLKFMTLQWGKNKYNLLERGSQEKASSFWISRQQCKGLENCIWTSHKTSFGHMTKSKTPGCSLACSRVKCQTISWQSKFVWYWDKKQKNHCTF